MARHRNYRNLNYDEYEYDDVYGHSVEDDCVSPTDASQWIYDRARGQHSMNEFLSNHRDIEEADEDDLEDELHPKHERRDSESFKMPDLEDEDKAKLLSCMDEIRSVLDDTTVSDKQLVETIMKYEYDYSKALDHLLSSTCNTDEIGPIESKTRKHQDLVETGERLIKQFACA